MFQKCTTIIEQHLLQLADILLLNGTLTECPGLVHGKLGISIFFFHYAQHTGNDIYADYAMDVISEALNQINTNSPTDYERGLAGIAVGINYLIQNKFLSVEDDICEDFDLPIKLVVMNNLCSNFSLYNGLAGYGYYWISRLNYHQASIQARECLLHIITQIERTSEDISITEKTDIFCFLSDLCQITGFECCLNLLEHFLKEWRIQSLDLIDIIPRLGGSNVGNIIRAYLYKQYFQNISRAECNIFLEQISDLDMTKVYESTGLLNGYAGEGMLRLTALDNNMSWMHLL